MRLGDVPLFGNYVAQVHEGQLFLRAVRPDKRQYCKECKEKIEKAKSGTVVPVCNKCQKMQCNI